MPCHACMRIAIIITDVTCQKCRQGLPAFKCPCSTDCANIHKTVGVVRIFFQPRTQKTSFAHSWFSVKFSFLFFFTAILWLSPVFFSNGRPCAWAIIDHTLVDIDWFYGYSPRGHCCCRGCELCELCRDFSRYHKTTIITIYPTQLTVDYNRVYVYDYA